MRQTLGVILLLSAVLAGFMGYCAALIDWVSDVKTGVYVQHQEEALWETSALVLYTWLGVRFIIRRMNLF